MTDEDKTESPLARLVVESKGTDAETLEQAERLAQDFAQKSGFRVEPAGPEMGADLVVLDQQNNVVMLVEAKQSPTELLSNARKNLDAVRVRNKEARERISRLKERVAS